MIALNQYLSYKFELGAFFGVVQPRLNIKCWFWYEPAEPSMLFKENFNGRVICFHYQENWVEMGGGQGRQRIHRCSSDLPRPGHRPVIHVIIDELRKKDLFHVPWTPAQLCNCRKKICIAMPLTPRQSWNLFTNFWRAILFFGYSRLYWRFTKHSNFVLSDSVFARNNKKEGKIN